MEHILKKSAHPIGVEGPVLTIVMDGVGIGNGKEGGHRSEGTPQVVHVQSGYNDTHSVVGQLVAYVWKALVEELRFVNTYDINVG